MCSYSACSVTLPLTSYLISPCLLIQLSNGNSFQLSLSWVWNTKLLKNIWTNRLYYFHDLESLWWLQVMGLENINWTVEKTVTLYINFTVEKHSRPNLMQVMKININSEIMWISITWSWYGQKGTSTLLYSFQKSIVFISWYENNNKIPSYIP